MRIELIASDSAGTRSMATYVETSDLKIIIDPSVALGPRRYGLPPHPLEYEKMEEDWREIEKWAKKAEVAVVTHYHYDHHNPEKIEILSGKRVFVKHPTQKINRSQRRRSEYFLSRLKEIAQVEYCDGRTYEFGSTVVEFSEPVFHGTSSRLGYVVEVFIESEGESFLFSSDVQGASIDDQIDFMLAKKPRIAYIDGALSYMLGYRFSQASLQTSIRNLKKLVEQRQLETLILDHHLLRDLKWREHMAEVINTAEKLGKEVVSAALFSGKEELMLEARRKILYERFPVE